MILPLALALASYHWMKAGRGSRHHRSFARILLDIGKPDIFKSLLLLLVATLIVVAIAFSLSRMGMVAALFGGIAFAVLARAARRRNLSSFKLLLASLVLSASIAVWIGAGSVVKHFAQLSHDGELTSHPTEGRLALWKDVATLIQAHPFTGVGLGCFEFAFTRFQSSELTLTIDHAHNDYLELASELGIPADALLLSLIFFVLFRSIAGALRAQSHRDRSIALGAVSGVLALLVHEAVDFNLYIPANALVFAVLLGISYSVATEQIQPSPNSGR